MVGTAQVEARPLLAPWRRHISRDNQALAALRPQFATLKPASIRPPLKGSNCGHWLPNPRREWRPAQIGFARVNIPAAGAYLQ